MSISPEKLALHFGLSSNADAPSHLGTRYDEAGTFLSDPGNTVVCHLQPETATEEALFDARQRYLGMADAQNLAFTAPESLHMTLFQGVLGRRRASPYWPENLPLDTPVPDVTALLLQRLEGFAEGPDFAVELVQAVPTGLIVDGVSEADRKAMAEWRNRFADLFGYRHPDHERYQFHITFAYPIRWIADERLPAWAMMLDEVTEDIRARAPVLELRAPAFCVFEDMNFFDELLVLDQKVTEPSEAA
ncbi:DUF1868 domain-containing protein [Devosia sp. LjRoot3]|uniref:DUF1868 domain-containing protein n=1 Tax=Devosia sp. LjRoot3 TaxID=3342319 RepID=UPI003ECFEC28